VFAYETQTELAESVNKGSDSTTFELRADPVASSKRSVCNVDMFDDLSSS
jgi:hypothetical protein